MKEDDCGLNDAVFLKIRKQIRSLCLVLHSWNSYNIHKRNSLEPILT